MTFSHVYEGYIVPASTLLPIGATIISYKKLGKAMHILFYYLCVALLINIPAIILANHGINNLPLLHFYTLFELEAVMWYYLLSFPAAWKGRLWIKVIMITYPILCVINFTFFQSIYEYNTYTRPLEAILIILFSTLYLSVHDESPSKPVHTSGRWVSFGFLLYFCSSLFLFIFSNIVTQNVPKDVTRMIWNIHDTFVLIMYIFFFIAIRHERRTR